MTESPARQGQVNLSQEVSKKQPLVPVLVGKHPLVWGQKEKLQSTQNTGAQYPGVS